MKKKPREKAIYIVGALILGILSAFLVLPQTISIIRFGMPGYYYEYEGLEEEQENIENILNNPDLPKDLEELFPNFTETDYNADDFSPDYIKHQSNIISVFKSWEKHKLHIKAAEFPILTLNYSKYDESYEGYNVKLSNLEYNRACSFIYINNPSFDPMNKSQTFSFNLTYYVEAHITHQIKPINDHHETKYYSLYIGLNEDLEFDFILISYIMYSC